MVGPIRQQRKPKVDKPVGTEYLSATERKNKEEKKYTTAKVQHYVSKKKIILLPGPVAEKK